jgi:hypothetical protein
MVLGALVVALVIGPGSADARGAATLPPAAPAQGSVDLAAALDSTGAFRGDPGLTGTVDLARWTLVSDLANGEPPRFAQAKRRTRPATAATWSAVGASGGASALSADVLALTAKRSALYLGGDFVSPLNAPSADSFAQWDGVSYAALGPNDSITGTVNAIAVDGRDLYVGGSFTNAAGGAADKIAMWDGSLGAWSPLNGTLDSTVRAIAISGGDVYVGGDFTNADGIAEADYIARYDGSWHNLGSHNSDGALADHVNAIAISGTTVYVGGLFTNAQAIPQADYVAKWTGSWAALGSNSAGTNGALSDQVHALLVSGNDLYVGGSFVNAAGNGAADYVARWRGGSWSGLGSTAALDARVYALAAAGPDLYLGGRFTDADGIPQADYVARWDGSAWSALGANASGGDGAIDDTVYALAVFDGDLYVGGVFEDAAGIGEADYLARWGLPLTYQPDGRVRLGTTGAFKGDGIYNTGGKNQKVTGTAARGSWITYQVSFQNDSPTSSDTFTVGATGAATADYTVKFLEGNADITADVLAGTYQVGPLQAGVETKIRVRIKVRNSAPAGSQVTRTVTMTSLTDPTKVDAVKVVGERS